jgi:hypothetical protein
MEAVLNFNFVKAGQRDFFASGGTSCGKDCQDYECEHNLAFHFLPPFLVERSRVISGSVQLPAFSIHCLASFSIRVLGGRDGRFYILDGHGYAVEHHR